MKKAIFLFVLTVFLNTYLLSQSRLDSINSLQFTYSPSALLNIYPGIQIGVEKGINGFGYLEVEGAYLDKRILDNRGRSDKEYGRRYKFTYKFPITKLVTFNILYIDRKTFHEYDNLFSRFGGAFFQQFAYTKTKHLKGFAFGMSNREVINKRFIIEYGIALGSGKYRVENEGVPEDAEEEVFRIWGFNDPGVYNYGIISLQLKLKYLLL